MPIAGLAKTTGGQLSGDPDVASGAACLPIESGSLWLLPEAAAVEPNTNTLLVADVHLGKSDSFRRQGVPVPDGANRLSLQRLSCVLKRYRPSHLVFLGDLVHDRLPAAHPVYEMLAGWRHDHSKIQMTLVLGNHDIKAGDLPAACGIHSVLPGIRLGPLSLLHEPFPVHDSSDRGHAVAGHIHPVIRLRAGRDSIRTKCFWARPGLTVLPAFGEFTGGFPIDTAPEDKVFIPDGRTVHRVPSAV